MATSGASPERKIGLAAFYNAIMAGRGISLAPHHYPLITGLEDMRIENLLYLGPPGCLAGDTQLMLRRQTGEEGARNTGHPLSIAEAWAKLRGFPVKKIVHRWDHENPHEKILRGWGLNTGLFLPALKGDRIGYHRVVDIVQSGVKQLYKVTASNGQSIRVTSEHPFKVPDTDPYADAEGFRSLQELTVGDQILVRSREKAQGGRKPNRERRVVYGIVHHPFAWKKEVAGKDYKRLNFARLVIEAAMNGLDTCEFIYTLKKDPIRSATFKYLAEELEVHHRDENPLNDDINNLEVLTHAEHLQRHAFEKQKNFGDILPVEATIVSIELDAKEMTYDVAMAAPYNNYVAHDFIVHNTGKSLLLDVGYAAWELGHDPSQTILSVSAGEKLPATFMTAVMQVIQNNKAFREIFPDVRPDQTTGWSMQRGLFVTGHHPEDENASYMACGLASKALTGLHCRTMILDDLHDKENALTPEGRARTISTYYDTLMGRADPRGCRRVAAGRWFAPDDIYQEWIAGGDWVVLELPAVRPGQRKLWYDVYVPKGLDCVYSENLPKDAIQDSRAGYTKYRSYYAAIDDKGTGFYWPGSPSKRKEYFTIERRQPRIAAINYRGDMTGGTDAVFSEEDFTPFMPPMGLEFGIAHQGVRFWCDSMKGEIESAWDTALGQVQSESSTVGLVGLMVPCNKWHRGEDPMLLGPCDFHYDVYLLDVKVENITFGQLVRMFREQYGLWHPRRMNVEEKQSGISLLQVMKNAKMPVHPIKVVEGKLERAVNPILMDELPVGGGAASVQGWAKMGRIFYPEGAPWWEAFKDKVCEFRGGTKASDEFDALVHLVTRAILRSRKIGRLAQALDTGASEVNLEDPRVQTLNAFGQFASQANNPFTGGVINPFQGLCGAPCHWFGIRHNSEYCGLHERRTTAMDGCTGWDQVGAQRALDIASRRNPPEGMYASD